LELGETPQRVHADAVAPAQVTLRAEVHDAATVIHAPEHLVVDGHRIQDIHDIKDDVRRAQHIAAQIKNHVGARLHVGGQACEAPILVRHHLGADQQADRLRHACEIRVGGRLRLLTLLKHVLGEAEHLARVDSLRASRDTGAAGRAHLRPAPSLVMALAAPQNIKDPAHHMLGGSALEIAVREHRADFDAFPACRALLQNLPRFRFDIGPQHRLAHSSSPGNTREDESNTVFSHRSILWLPLYAIVLEEGSGGNQKTGALSFQERRVEFTLP
jgi:hypothetical protein